MRLPCSFAGGIYVPLLGALVSPSSRLLVHLGHPRMAHLNLPVPTLICHHELSRLRGTSECQITLTTRMQVQQGMRAPSA